MSDAPDIVEQMRGFSADHGPDGWPAVQMREITALCDEVDRLRAISAQPAAVPGWQWVPVEPTEAMLAADVDPGEFVSIEAARTMWRAMLAAAPQAPQQDGEA